MPQAAGASGSGAPAPAGGKTNNASHGSITSIPNTARRPLSFARVQSAVWGTPGVSDRKYPAAADRGRQSAVFQCRLAHQGARPLDWVGRRARRARHLPLLVNNRRFLLVPKATTFCYTSLNN